MSDKHTLSFTETEINGTENRKLLNPKQNKYSDVAKSVSLDESDCSKLFSSLTRKLSFTESKPKTMCLLEESPFYIHRVNKNQDFIFF
jgi:hypothetical protein